MHFAFAIENNITLMRKGMNLCINHAKLYVCHLG